VTANPASCEFTDDNNLVTLQGFAGSFQTSVQVDSENNTRGASYLMTADAEGFFEILSPTSSPSIMIPVLVISSGSVTINGNGHGGSSVLLDGTVLGQTTANPDIACVPAGTPTYCTSNSFGGIQHVIVSSNSVHSIGIDATVEADGPGLFEALTDPTVVIDPAFLADNPGYSIVTSDGWNNAATPEPALAPVLLLALASVLAMRKRGTIWQNETGGIH